MNADCVLGLRNSELTYIITILKDMSVGKKGSTKGRNTIVNCCRTEFISLK